MKKLLIFSLLLILLSGCAQNSTMFIEGFTDFIDLEDTPASYSGCDNFLLVVNSDGNAVICADEIDTNVTFLQDVNIATGEIYGTRELVTYGRAATSITTDFYMYHHGIIGSCDTGYVADRNGSIIGLSLRTGQLGVQAFTDLHIQPRINCVTAWSYEGDPTGNVYQSYWDTQPRGVYDFNAGDLIQMYLDLDGVGYTLVHPIGTLELVYND